MTFRHLADPDPPEATPVHRARVGARARRLGYRRRLLPVVLLLPVVAAGGALALAGGSRPGDGVGVVASGSGGEAPADTTVEPTTTTAPSTTTSSSSTTTTTTTPPAVQPTCSPKPAAEAPPPDFEVWLTLDKTVVAVGEPLVFTVHGRHNGSEPFEYVDGHGGPTQDVFVVAEDGTVVWHAWYQRTVPGVTSPKRFAPGEEQVRQETWQGEVCTGGGSPGFSPPGTAGPGRYTAHALWRKGWWGEPVAFEVR